MQFVAEQVHVRSEQGRSALSKKLLGQCDAAEAHVVVSEQPGDRRQLGRCGCDDTGIEDRADASLARRRVQRFVSDLVEGLGEATTTRRVEQTPTLMCDRVDRKVAMSLRDEGERVLASAVGEQYGATGQRSLDDGGCDH